MTGAVFVPPPGTLERWARQRAQFEATMSAPAEQAEAHTVRRGDAMEFFGEWLSVSASFAENAGSGSTTVWAIYGYLDDLRQPPRRWAGSPGARIAVRRAAP